MKDILELALHFILTLFTLLRPGGVKAVIAENLNLKQQLITINRSKKRSPNLKAFDRFFFGFISFFIDSKRLKKISITVKPATILRFHRALVNRKYSEFYSNNKRRKPGRKGPDHAIINLVIEIKNKNPSIGYGRIAMQIYHAFGVEISRFAVARILRKHSIQGDPSDNSGPSWLTFIGHMKDSLWSVDLFRCESISLKTHWVMVVIDQYTRRIIGFSVHAGDCDGVAYCRMFNSIISNKQLPKYLSSDNDPLFQFYRWQANLRILDIEEIKSTPGVPQSHPFIERVIGSIRREYLDHILFFNKVDLESKLRQYQQYYNETRGHSSLQSIPPSKASENMSKTTAEIKDIGKYRWESYCRGALLHK